MTIFLNNKRCDTHLFIIMQICIWKGMEIMHILEYCDFSKKKKKTPKAALVVSFSAPKISEHMEASFQ